MKSKPRKGVIVEYEGYYSTTQCQLVVGTCSVLKAVKAVKADQQGYKFKFISAEVFKNTDFEGETLNYALFV
jgi:hypothetical protein